MEITELTNDTFDAFIAEHKNVLVDFWAEWCGPCKMMHPVFESLPEKYPATAFARVNVDLAPELCEKYGIMSIPAFVSFKDGSASERRIGAMPESELTEIIQ